MKKVARNKKKSDKELPEDKTTQMTFSSSHVNSAPMSDKKNKLKKKKRNKENSENEDVQHDNVVRDDSNQQNEVARNRKRKDTKTISQNNNNMSDKKKKKLRKKKRKEEDLLHSNEVGPNSNQQIGKSKSSFDATLLDDEGVYQISSGDENEDEKTGMKRWINEYHEDRPGADVLLQRINDFLVDYWSQKEKERKEKESEAAEGGWTVVTHMKGRKKTTDVESGTTVGSVAQAAVLDNISKKKNKKAGLNFYRFQAREAQRNEIMMLQSKFEQDKKRIQQMRAERKFRPY